MSNESLTAELINNNLISENFIFINDVSEFQTYKNADVILDLLFDNSPGRITILNQFLSKTVIINSVVDTLSVINSHFIRVNGWPTFLRSNIVEASGINEHEKQNAEIIFQQLNKTIEWLPDKPGFVTPRVISMIINEAYFALAEEVSTKEEINIAMKLGTNYAFGPFEWAEKIGLGNITALLNKLSIENLRYEPCDILMKEAEAK